MKPDKDGRWWPTARQIGNITARNGKVQIWHGEWIWSLDPEQAKNLAEILDAAAETADN